MDKHIEQYKAEELASEIVGIALDDNTIDELIHEAGLDALRDFAASI